MRFRLLWADDIFISYSRKDGATYAFGLAEALDEVGFSCFLDRLGTDADEGLPPSLLRKLKSCSMLVVVGSQGAAESAAVGQEIVDFARAKGGTSRIVPVDFGGAVQAAGWLPQVVGIATESEAVEALEHGNPSRSVVTRIGKAFGYARSKQRLRRYSTAAVTLLTVAVVAALASYVYAQNQLAVAAQATEEARVARLDADRERKAADEAKRQADEQARLAKEAEGKRIEAEGKAADAEGKAADAEGKAADAERKAGDALLRQQSAEERERAATANAARQEKVGASQRLASQGARQFDHQLDLGLVLNAEALDVYDTYEARNGLLGALQHSPRLLAHLDLGLRGAPGPALIDALISADEKTFAARNHKGVTLWDVASGGEILSVARENVYSFALSPDGRLLALGSHEKLFLWDVPARRELPAVEIPGGGQGRELTFDPTGKYLAFIGGIFTDVYLIDTSRPAARPVPLAGDRYALLPKALAFSPDGKLLAAAGGGITVWDVATRVARPGWPSGQSDFVLSYDHITFSPDGKTLVTAADFRKKLVTWDVGRHEQLRQYDLDGGVTSLAFNRKGDLLAVGTGGAIRLLAAADMGEVERLSAGRTSRVARLSFTKDDGKLISVAEEVLIWDVSDDQHLGRPLGDHRGAFLAVAFSPDGKYLLSAGGASPVVMRDARTGEALGQPFGKDGSAGALAFSRDGKVLAMVTSEAGNDDSVVQVWDFKGSRLINTPYRDKGHFLGEMALSPDGGLLAVGNYEVIFLDTATGRQRGEKMDFPGTESVNSMAFSPDGRLLAVGTSSGHIVLVNARTLKRVGALSISTSPTSAHVRALAFSPDGRTLVSNTQERGGIILWDVASRTRLRELVYPGLRTDVRAVAFSPDGRMLAMAGDTFNLGPSKEHPVVLWDAETYQPLGQPLTGHTSPVNRLAFNPKCGGCPDARLVSGDAAGSLRLWEVGVASWQRRACALTNRRLTDEERGFYFKDASRRGLCSGPLSFAALAAPTAAAGRTPLSRRVEKPDDLHAREQKELAQYGAGDEEEETAEAKLRRIVKEQLSLGSGEILPGHRLAEDLGADESKRASLFRAVEKGFGIDIRTGDAKKIVTFKDLLSFVVRRIRDVGVQE